MRQPPSNIAEYIYAEGTGKADFQQSEPHYPPVTVIFFTQMLRK